MKILVTGAKGFVGKNLIAELKNREYKDIYEYDVDTEPSMLDGFTSDCDFVFHLAANSDIEKSFKNPDTDFDNKRFDEHIKKHMKLEGIQDILIKVFDNEDAYINRLTQLSKSDQSVQPNEKLVNLLKNISV